jgi:dTDP-4-amino-4,6-dideoxygalactose transaminase
MDDIRSAIGLAQLDKIEDDLKKRAEIRKMYINNLKEVSGIIIPFENYTEFSSNYIFPIVLKDSTFEKRDKIREQLAEAGVQTSVHYPAVHRFSIYNDFYSELPVTDYLVDNLITLPMYSKLTIEDIEFISNKFDSLL